jgi:hypothetical protein
MRITKLTLSMVFAVLPTIFACAAQAQWLPQWTTLWEYPDPFHTASPLLVRVDADGATFAVVDLTHHSLAHVALLRFDADGSLAWAREDTGFGLGGLVLMSGGRVAIAGRNDGFLTPVYVRVYDALSGDLAWQRDAGDGLTFDSLFGTQQMALDASGNLMISAADNHGFVVIRFDSNGNALPTWQHAIGSLDGISAHSIVALPDGGAVVSGQGGFVHGGIVTVRFDAQGNEVFTDVELGDLGNPLGDALVALDTGGNVVVASSLESSSGVAIARVWRLSPDGQRLWTKVLPHPASPLNGTGIGEGGLQLAANGDPLVVVDMGFGPFRLVRFAALTGEYVWNVNAPIGDFPTGLSQAPNGRLLIGGYETIPGNLRTSIRLAEFDSNGTPCRIVATDNQLVLLQTGASATGWSVLGSTEYVDGVGNDAVLYRYDADGPCTLSDQVFANGFDGVVLP